MRTRPETTPRATFGNIDRPGPIIVGRPQVAQAVRCRATCGGSDKATGHRGRAALAVALGTIVALPELTCCPWPAWPFRSP